MVMASMSDGPTKYFLHYLLEENALSRAGGIQAGGGVEISYTLMDIIRGQGEAGCSH